ncbi:hypothetical protein T11_11167 [Trichinella zimbabwensis]|uniref:Uncharacterized protein n=1 Tax=Trichinella zimbabwensis TaxID=268475 RepID=A0A0V1G7V8_9BILA|nr:hypothetical protein T11_11167 [Trichinella zimbabwensis]
MRAKLFKGKPPLVRQNSGGVDFVERKRHGGENTARGGNIWGSYCGENGTWRKNACKVV